MVRVLIAGALALAAFASVADAAARQFDFTVRYVGSSDSGDVSVSGIDPDVLASMSTDLTPGAEYGLSVSVESVPTAPLSAGLALAVNAVSVDLGRALSLDAPRPSSFSGLLRADLGGAVDAPEIFASNAAPAPPIPGAVVDGVSPTLGLVLPAPALDGTVPATLPLADAISASFVLSVSTQVSQQFGDGSFRYNDRAVRSSEFEVVAVDSPAVIALPPGALRLGGGLALLAAGARRRRGGA